MQNSIAQECQKYQPDIYDKILDAVCNLISVGMLYTFIVYPIAYFMVNDDQQYEKQLQLISPGYSPPNNISNFKNQNDSRGHISPGAHDIYMFRQDAREKYDSETEMKMLSRYIQGYPKIPFKQLINMTTDTKTAYELKFTKPVTVFQTIFHKTYNDLTVQNEIWTYLELFKNTIFYRKNLENLHITGNKYNFSNTNFSHANLKNAYFKDVKLNNSMFQLANFDNTIFENISLRNASFDMTNLTKAQFKNIDLGYSSIISSDLSNLDLTNSYFIETDFSGSDLSGVDFTGSNLMNANFSYANLTNTKFDNAFISGAKFDQAIGYKKNAF